MSVGLGYFSTQLPSFLSGVVLPSATIIAEIARVIHSHKSSQAIDTVLYSDHVFGVTNHSLALFAFHEGVKARVPIWSQLKRVASQTGRQYLLLPLGMCMDADEIERDADGEEDARHPACGNCSRTRPRQVPEFSRGEFGVNGKLKYSAFLILA